MSQVARLADAKDALERVQKGSFEGVPINRVKYPGPGWAIFMQGSKMCHGVTPVKEAKEPRLTLVQSLQSCNPFAEALTRYRLTKVQDPSDAAKGEIGRHYAWRAAGKLDYLIKKGLFTESGGGVVDVLTKAIDDLMRGRDLILDKVKEDAPYKVDRRSDLFEEMMRRKDETLEGGESERGAKRRATPPILLYVITLLSTPSSFLTFINTSAFVAGALEKPSSKL